VDTGVILPSSPKALVDDARVEVVPQLRAAGNLLDFSALSFQVLRLGACAKSENQLLSSSSHSRWLSRLEATSLTCSFLLLGSCTPPSWLQPLGAKQPTGSPLIFRTKGRCLPGVAPAEADPGARTEHRERVGPTTTQQEALTRIGVYPP
jgi:hypothetical protein